MLLHSSKKEDLECDTPDGISKRSKHSFQPKTFSVSLTFAAKIPLNSIALAVRGEDVEHNCQDALRVLDTVLRQQAANRFPSLFVFCFFYWCFVGFLYVFSF